MNWARRMSYGREYRWYVLENPTADTQNKTECCNSGVCCWRRPGTLNKEDLQRLSDLKKLTLKEFFKQFCIVDSTSLYTSQTEDKWILMLKRAHQQGGVFLSSDETFSFQSPCIFLIDKKCSVHEDKPKLCKEFKCWDKSTSSALDDVFSWTKKELEELGWDGYIDEDDLEFE